MIAFLFSLLPFSATRWRCLEVKRTAKEEEEEEEFPRPQHAAHKRLIITQMFQTSDKLTPETFSIVL